MLKGISLYNLLTDEYSDMTFVNTVNAMRNISKQIEFLCINNFLAVDFFACFQYYSRYLKALDRFERLAQVARRVYIIGVPDAEVPQIPGIEYIPIEEDSYLAQEWFLVVNTPSFYTTLLTKEMPGRDPISGQRRYSGAWTFDEEIVSKAYLLLTQFLGIQYRPVRHREYEPQSRYAAEVANKLIIKLENVTTAKSRNARLNRAMTGIATTVASDMAPERMMDQIAADLSTQFRSQTVAIWQPKPATAEITLEAATGLPSNWRDAAYRSQPITNINLAAAQAYNEEKTIYVSNAQREGRTDMFDPAAKSIIAVPMQARGKLMGILQLTSQDEEAFAKTTQETIEAIGSQLAMIMLTLNMSGGASGGGGAVNPAAVSTLQNRIGKMNDEVLSLLTSGNATPEQMQAVNRIVQLNTELSSIANQMGSAPANGNGSGYTQPMTAPAMMTPQQPQMQRVAPAPAAQPQSSFDMDFMSDFGSSAPATPAQSSNGLLMDKLSKQTFIDDVNRGMQQPQTVDVKSMVAQIVSDFQVAAGQNRIEIENRTHQDMPNVMADPKQLHQAISQLVDNAVKYSGPDTKIHVLSNTDGDNAVIAVRDTGRGIMMKDLPFIFDKGYRGEGEMVPGDGLGLAIVQAVAEKHGGKAWVRSKPEQGSIVFMRLPMEA